MFNRFLLGTILVLAATPSLACNWVNPNGSGPTRYLECRTNWKGLMADAPATKRMVEIATSMARGHAEQLANLVPRQAGTVDESDLIHTDETQVNELITNINHRIRRDSAKGDAQSPALPVGFFVGLSFAIEKFPGVDALLRPFGAKSGGSFMLGGMVVPMAIEKVFDVNTSEILDMNTGMVENLETKTTYPVKDSEAFMKLAKEVAEDRADSSWFVGRWMKSLAHLVGDTQSMDYTNQNWTVDYRSFIVVAGDLAPGVDDAKKRASHVNFGLLWGPQVVSTHQLFGSGWAFSVPALAAEAFAAKTVLPKALQPFARGLGLNRLGVETIKYGWTSTTAQDVSSSNHNFTDSIVTFRRSRWLWFRWKVAHHNNSNGVLDSANLGNYRVNKFEALALQTDGETTSAYNGIELNFDGEDGKQNIAFSFLEGVVNSAAGVVATGVKGVSDAFTEEEPEEVTAGEAKIESSAADQAMDGAVVSADDLSTATDDKDCPEDDDTCETK